MMPHAKRFFEAPLILRIFLIAPHQSITTKNKHNSNVIFMITFRTERLFFINSTGNFPVLRKNKWLPLFLMILVSLTATCHSQELIMQDINREKSPERASAIGDRVDPHSGDLIIEHNDLTWPGNGGLDIIINRVYSAQESYGGTNSILSRSFSARILGSGWNMVVAPRWIDTKPRQLSPLQPYRPPFDLTNLCRNTEFFYFYEPAVGSYLELPSGAREYMIFVGNYTATSKNNWRAVCKDNIVTVTSPDGLRYDMGNISPASVVSDTLYGPSGDSQLLNAIKVTDLFGNWIAYTYLKASFFGFGLVSDETGLTSVPTSITSSDGRQVNFTYSGSSPRLRSMYDNTGRTWEYEYSEATDTTSHALIGVTLPEGRTWKFSYTGGPGGVNDYAVFAVSRRLASITYPQGGTITYTMEAAPRVAAKGSKVYSYFPRVKYRTLSTGGTWSYSYIHGGLGQYDTTTEERPDGVIMTYKHMGSGYANSPDYTVASNTGWLYGRLIESSDNLGNKDVFTWRQREISAQYRRISGPEWVRDAKTWAADLASKIIYRDGATYSTTFSDFDNYGNPGTIVESGPNGGSRTTTRTYNIDTNKWLVNQVKDESYPGSAVTRVYDANGKVSSATKDGVTTSFTYDNFGNVETVTHPRGLVYSYSNYRRGIAQQESQPEGIAISRVVDDAGNVLSETNGEGQTSTTVYDKLGRPTLITYPIGSTKTFSYGPTWKSVTRGYLVEHTDYDGFGLPIRISLDSITTDYSYDAFGRKTFQSNPDSAEGTSYEYDRFGRLTAAFNADGTSKNIRYGTGTVTVTNERGQPTAFGYRAYGDPDRNHVISIATPVTSANVSIVRNNADFITSVTQGAVIRTYDYNSNNYLIGVTNPETEKTIFGRDIAGNLTSLQVGTSRIKNLGYDGQNRLVSVLYLDSTPAVTHTYSKTGKLKSVTTSVVSRGYIYDDNDNLTSETQIVDGIAMTIGYGYNTVDQLSTITYPFGQVIDYAPDMLGRPTQVSGYISRISYWPSGQISQLLYANGVETSYDQNMRLWPASFTTQGNGGYYIKSSYGYDGVGNLTSLTDSIDAAYNRNLDYDGIDRLTTAAGSWGSGTISYDGIGNISKQVLGAFGLYYGYDANNRLTSLSGFRSGAYTYDAIGNVSSALGNTYTYDNALNLRCVNCSNISNKIEYVYDGLNQRVSVVKGGIKTYEIYGSHGNQLIEYVQGQSNKLTEYIYLGGKRIAQRVSTR